MAYPSRFGLCLRVVRAGVTCSGRPGHVFLSTVERVLLHFYPLPLVDPDQVAALAPDFISIMDAVVFNYPASPAVEHLPFADLEISEYLALASGTLYSDHFV